MTKINYIKTLRKLYPNITSGRKNFHFFENRIKKNIKLTNIYFKNTKTNSKILYK